VSKTFGLAFAVGATLAPSVLNVFSTIDQQIKAKSNKLQSLEGRSEAAAKADALQRRTMELQRLYAAGGGKDPLVRAQMQKSVEMYRIAQAEASKYGLKVGQYGIAHARAAREIAKTTNALEILTRKQAVREHRKELRGRMLDAVAPLMTVAAPVKWAVDFESGMADAAKTIEGMRDSAGRP
jgi:hypothetical protein